MIFSRWNNAPPSPTERPLLQPFSWKKLASPHDGRAALPDTPSSPVKDQNRLKRISSKQTLLHPIVRRSSCCCRAAPAVALRNRDSRTAQERTPALASAPYGALFSPRRSRGCCATAAALATMRE